MKTHNETPDNLNFNKLLASLSVSQSRRAFFKGAAAGAAGIAAVGAGSLLLPRSAYAGGGEGAEDTVVQILSIAATAEELAVTFYSHGIANASKLGISGANLSYLQAAVKEFCLLGQPGLAQIAAQICGIENEHRALGRDIGGLIPADNWAFSPALVEAVADAVDVLAAEGFLSPKSGNSFTYHAVSTADHGVINRQPFTAGEDND
jgi:hypothetical protein